MNFLRCGCALVLFATTAAAASAQTPTASSISPGLDLDVAYVYYDAHGSTPEELHASLRNNGPSTGGATYFAATSSQTGFGYKTEEQNGRCRLTDVGVTVKISMLLPLWGERDRAPEPLRRAWDEFLDRLLLHEGGHVRITDRFSRDLYNGLKTLTANSCNLLDSQSKAFIDDLSRRQDEANSAYDLETRHGMNEGAVWPPSTTAAHP